MLASDYVFLVMDLAILTPIDVRSLSTYVPVVFITSFLMIPHYYLYLEDNLNYILPTVLSRITSVGKIIVG
jgi:hypothetical protein